jgi:hypothetical protein
MNLFSKEKTQNFLSTGCFGKFILRSCRIVSKIIDKDFKSISKLLINQKQVIKAILSKSRKVAKFSQKKKLMLDEF